MKKIISNFFVIVLTAPIVAFTAIVGGLVSGLYYSLFYIYTKLCVRTQESLVRERVTHYRREEDR